ncbi:hypothetical protein FisN_5Hh334 [Fistulifera solaris]|jgi:peptidoglycan/LPS O-acetylase OafA/YrhL|uniref:Acyltransferase 3 domain-containing protein n=1 Tax=Fistulifera solaris TaxID=1519565 RepID=A0A1Z5JSV4_FISSO|nr:hypothetical protein FisN_5Hh334 [Fistulifera solaris]|eukprot:GAX16956.1 hypothetical protein FisN_5Hh334 [Fistulifera solaris]
MARLSRFIFAFIIAESFAFATQSKVPKISPAYKSLSFIPQPASTRAQEMSGVLRIRGGGPLAAEATPAAPAKKIRITAFDSMRFFLIAVIVLGHFIKFANPSDFVFKFVSQHNIAVGAFFALSGYVTAYTSTELGKREPSPKLLDTPKQKWVLSRIFGYYPLHLVTLLLFSPVFLYADVTYNGWMTTAINGLMSVTMTQAWFPMHAEVWNAPTWYLSALSFITALMPFGLPSIAKMNKSQLRKTAGWLFATLMLPKLGYLHDLNCWSVVEGVVNPKAHPNLALFNLLRFSPLYNAAEVFLGIVACRLVMLDSDPDEKEKKVKTNALSTLIPIVSLVGFSALRGLDVIQCSEFVARHLFFVPMFLRLLMACHRNTVNNVSDLTCTILSNPLLVWLGNLAFPIFIVHGPIGQIFFKKLIATKLFGGVLMGPTNFAAYLAATVGTAYVLQKTVLQNKAVSDWSNKAVNKLSAWM